MKNIILICGFLFILIFGVTPAVNSQVLNLTPVSVIPAGPYHCGQVITVMYDLDYQMLTGSQITLSVAYDNTQLQLLTFTPSYTGLFLPLTIVPVGSITTNTYLTNPFTVNENGFISATEFTVSFLVINCDCPPANSDIITQASTNGSDNQTLTTPVSILNTNSGASVSIELIAGSDCDVAMYKVITAGNDDPNSTINFNMPTGITVTNVYNTNGLPVIPVTQTGTGYQWDRSGNSNEDLQIHYVVVQFNPANPCAYSLDLTFTTHNICDNSLITVTASRPINCCVPPPPPCPSCPPPIGTILLPGGGFVSIHKWLEQTPFRYFPSPDNCRTHDYFIKVDNMSNEDLSNFHLGDLLADIVPLHPNTILVTDVQVSLNPLMGSSTPTFDFITTPGGNIISSITSPSSLQSIYTTNAIFPNALAWSPNPQTWSIDHATTGTLVFPRWSSLLVKITHRLDDNTNPQPTNYTNTSNLTFDVNTFHGDATVSHTSRQDLYDPVVTIEKNVKLSTDPDASYTSSISVDPGTTVKFRIKIRNYGMANVTWQNLNDAISNSIVGNFGLPDATTVTVTGSPEYSAADLAAIFPIIQGSVSASTSTGFNCSTPVTLKAAPCPGFTELEITYTVPVNSAANITCNSDYLNTATLNWAWTDVNNVTTNHSVSDQASVNVDLFKNISFKLEATCDTTNASSWTINNINGVPGQRIYYRATVWNNNSYTVSGIKIMVQLPCGTGTNISTHNSTPMVTLTTTPPTSPPGTGLIPSTPVCSPPPFVMKSAATNDWLSTNISPSGVAGIQAIYKTVTLNSGQTATINFYVNVPTNSPGATYNTAMGISLSSLNTGTTCPLVRRTDLNLTVAASNACDTLTQCTSILYDKKIRFTSPNIYKVTLFNIVSTGGFNIDNMDIIVHQPYKECAPWGPPYVKTMVPYEIGPITVTSPYTPPITNVNFGQRYYNVSTVGTGGFGNVTFDILANITPSNSCPIVFPINVVFKDSTKECTLCENTFYFWIDRNGFVVH